MFFYPDNISQEAVVELASSGIEGVQVGPWEGRKAFEIPDQLIRERNKNSIILTNGVRMERHPIRFDGHRSFPVRSLDQCPKCGRWMSDKPSPSDEDNHLRECSPKYKWVLAAKVRA